MQKNQQGLFLLDLPSPPPNDDWIQDSNNYFVHVANRFLLSRAYFVFYLFMIILNIVLVVWIIGNTAVLNTSAEGQQLFITIELVVNFSLLFEVILRFFAQRKNYFQSNSNRLDVFIVTLSWFGLIIHFVTPLLIFEEDLISSFLIIFRYAIQFARLFLMIKNEYQKKNSMKNAQLPVNFQNLQFEEVEEETSSSF